MSEQSELREKLWYGVPFRQALQDAIARNNTGYSYEELKQAIADDEDMLDGDELKQVDEMVNLLLHMFVFYHSHRPVEPVKNAPEPLAQGGQE